MLAQFPGLRCPARYFVYTAVQAFRHPLKQQSRSRVLERLCWKIKLATAYSCMTFRQATIGFAAFHCRVRDGNGWGHCGISPEIYPAVVLLVLLVGNGNGLARVLMMDLGSQFNLSCQTVNGWGWGPEVGLKTAHKRLNGMVNDMDAKTIKNVRTISSDMLSRLPWLVHSPYRVVVFHGPVITNLGMSLALRCFQRLSLPHLATQPCH